MMYEYDLCNEIIFFFTFSLHSKKTLLLRRNYKKNKTMTVVSSKEFTTHQKKYYNKAVSENVFIKRGKNMFIVSIANNAKKDVDKQPQKTLGDFWGVLSENEKSLKDLKGKITFSDDYDYKLMRS